MNAYHRETDVFDDAQRAAAELCAGLRVGKKALALLTCDYQLDHLPLAAAVEKRLGCPLVGMTTYNFPLSQPNEERAARLVVYENEGLEVSLAAGGPFGTESPEAEMNALFDRCMAGMQGTPKMFLLMLSPWDADKDWRLIDTVFHRAGDVPVFGGVPSAEPDGGLTAVFTAAASYHEGAVLVALGGSIRPIFAVGAQLTLADGPDAIVTKCDGCLVHEVDGIPFADWLLQQGFAGPGETARTALHPLFEYGPLSVQLRGRVPEEDDIHEIFGVSEIDEDTGSGYFTSWVPRGARIRMGRLNKGDIAASAITCLDDLLNRAAEQRRSGHEYSLLMAVSCVTRHLAQIGGEDYESRLLLPRIPDTLTPASFFAFGEICPTGGVTGGAHNRSFGGTLCMCAL